jgi:hypothetical protein
MFDRFIRVVTGIAFCVYVTGLASAQSKTQAVSFETPPSPHLKRSVKVSGNLTLPVSPGKVPAIVILHSRAGIDGTGVFYAEALNRAGIATLEIQPYLEIKSVSVGDGSPNIHLFVRRREA